MYNTFPAESCSDKTLKLSVMFAFWCRQSAQHAKVPHGAPCLKGFKAVGHEFIENPWFRSVWLAQLNLTTFDWLNWTWISVFARGLPIPLFQSQNKISNSKLVVVVVVVVKSYWLLFLSWPGLLLRINYNIPRLTGLFGGAAVVWWWHAALI